MMKPDINPPEAAATQGSGIYTWVISTDTFYSDDFAAAAFGIDREKARAGLPIQDYLARIHRDDLPRVTKAILDTIATGRPCNEVYRVCRPDGSVRQIMGFGACFRDSNGQPSHYSGVLVPAPAVETACGEDAIVAHLVAAHDLADSKGWAKLADKIVDTLEHLAWQENGGAEPELVGHLH